MSTKQAASKADQADQVEQPTTADQVEQPTIADQVEQPTIADQVEQPTIADQVEQPTIADQVAAPAFTHRITAVPATGFCRAGGRWYREGTNVNRNDFSGEQWDALNAEPMLVVVRI